jgi:hypothetical protein
MLKSNTPEELLNLRVKEFNKGNMDLLMTLYEDDACFACKSGQVVKGQVVETFKGSLKWEAS